MIVIDRIKIGIAILITILVAAGVWTGYTIVHAATPVRIGVLLPMTGDVEIKEPLEWAKDTINSEGRVAGRKVELVYRDTGAGNAQQLAQDLLADKSIHIIIGPDSSDDLYALAPAFTANKKILISPMSTSGDIIRAFGKNGYIWRTTQGDAAQVRTILSILKARGVKKIALLAENSTYGKTFYDWTGFFATEYGIEVTSISQFDPGSPAIDGDVADVIKTNPDYLVAVAFPPDAVKMKQAMDRSGTRTKLFLTDSAAKPLLIASLGPAAEGLEGTSPTADPGSGFVDAYMQKFKHPPSDFAAPVYDALMIAAFTEARQEKARFESYPESVRQIVQGEGTVTGWNATGIRTAMEKIRTGPLPWITGASGGLEYDQKLGIDPISTWYSLWEVHNGTFQTLNTYSIEEVDADKTNGESIGVSRGSADLMTSAAPSAVYVPEVPRRNFEAVIVGPSRGWPNYRHQADALTVYDLLRANGVDDDHIILMVYDDVPTAPENPLPGNIHNFPKGENIRAGAVIDYAGPEVSTGTFRNVLSGTRTEATPVVLDSDANTDVFVYIASHGAPGRIVFGTGNSSFTTGDFTALTEAMHRDNKYRQMAFVVDTCFGESIATGATAPGIYYLTGAAKNEPSLGAVYDMDIRQWLSDEFTVNVVDAIHTNGNITFRQLYPVTYKKVTGSHVRLITTGNFSLDTPVLKFL